MVGLISARPKTNVPFCLTLTPALSPRPLILRVKKNKTKQNTLGPRPDGYTRAMVHTYDAATDDERSSGNVDHVGFVEIRGRIKTTDGLPRHLYRRPDVFAIARILVHRRIFFFSSHINLDPNA